MEFNIKFDQKMFVEAANRVLDEFEYNGKTIREWADSLTHPKTNADRIRAMSDEDLAKYFANAASHECIPKLFGNCPNVGECVTCDECWLDWVKREADNG